MLKLYSFHINENKYLNKSNILPCEVESGVGEMLSNAVTFQAGWYHSRKQVNAAPRNFDIFVYICNEKVLWLNVIC